MPLQVDELKFGDPGARSKMIRLIVYDVDGEEYQFQLRDPGTSMTYALSDRLARVYQEAGMMERDPDARRRLSDMPVAEFRRVMVAWLMAVIPELTPELVERFTPQTITDMYIALNQKMVDARKKARELAGMQENEGDGAGPLANGSPATASASAEG